MLLMFAQIWKELTATILSLILTFGTTLGTIVPANTTDSADYFDGNVKNVIYLIGDGMGFNHLEKAKKERSISLVMDTFEERGASMTRSYTSSVTDSAAGGTALSTGERTFNGGIGVYFSDAEAVFSYPKNITELCLERGMMTGVITSDQTSGATPASFSAHESDRGNTEEITEDQLNSGINLIWGTSNGLVSAHDAKVKGYQLITSYDEMMALPEGSSSFGQFTNDLWTLQQSDASTPTLLQMTMKAIDLLDDTDEGFFLMVEGAHIDKHSHSNLDDNMTEAVEAFDKAIQYALEYAKNDGETLVIVTADHETGAIVLNDDGSYSFTSGSHSGVDVPLLVYGSDKLLRGDEVINNYEVPIRIAYTLGFTEDQFPYEVKVA
ncbi:MAG: alkaline phosphatase [Clostridia bacterium]|nr:alkaline phosphatase [Clostridia bacterium]